ncbi:hypothetical protein SAMN05192534_10995 [Alteribacillus persepolensis]|uniref:Uncharacterized protein n=1 Tax=Alteribacillus persepolensis TaxID=568899 RepID=A0A1G8EH06_9BACI|nr:hypothetical protein SAMN05192534_10995 [Alteribacillus persepolensis]
MNKINESDNKKVIEALKQRNNGDISKEELIEKLKSIFHMK